MNKKCITTVFTFLFFYVTVALVYAKSGHMYHKNLITFSSYLVSFFSGDFYFLHAYAIIIPFVYLIYLPRMMASQIGCYVCKYQTRYQYFRYQYRTVLCFLCYLLPFTYFREEIYLFTQIGFRYLNFFPIFYIFLFQWIADFLYCMGIFCIQQILNNYIPTLYASLGVCLLCCTQIFLYKISNSYFLPLRNCLVAIHYMVHHQSVIVCFYDLLRLTFLALLLYLVYLQTNKKKEFYEWKHLKIVFDLFCRFLFYNYYILNISVFSPTLHLCLLTNCHHTPHLFWNMCPMASSYKCNLIFFCLWYRFSVLLREFYYSWLKSRNILINKLHLSGIILVFITCSIYFCGNVLLYFECFIQNSVTIIMHLFDTFLNLYLLFQLVLLLRLCVSETITILFFSIYCLISECMVFVHPFRKIAYLIFPWYCTPAIKIIFIMMLYFLLYLQIKRKDFVWFN